MNNFQIIQSMSLENLADALCSGIAECCPPTARGETCPEGDQCIECWKAWLLKEREDAQCATLHSAPGARRVVEDADPYKGDAE